MNEFLASLSVAVFFFCAFFISWLDIKTQKLPNAYLTIMLVIAFAYAVLSGFVYINLLEALCVGSAFVIFELFYRRMCKKPALGFGDIKLLTVWCLFAGAKTSLFGFALGLGIGALCAFFRKKRTFAAGPWINVASAIIFML